MQILKIQLIKFIKTHTLQSKIIYFIKIIKILINKH